MVLHYQLLKTERSDEPLSKSRPLDASKLEEAQTEARKMFATSRRMAKASGDPVPQAVRITEYEVELWRWTMSNEIAGPRLKGP